MIGVAGVRRRLTTRFAKNKLKFDILINIWRAEGSVSQLKRAQELDTKIHDKTKSQRTALS